MYDRIARFFGCDLNWLRTGVGHGGEGAFPTGLISPDASPGSGVLRGEYEAKEIISGAQAGRRIRVVSWAQAGELTDYEEMPSEWQLEVATDCTDANAVGVQLRGDSMLPIYQEGDIVVIMPSREPRTGCLVVAKLRDEGVAFKLYAQPTRGIIRLSSYNPAYSPIERNRDDFEWICPVFETRRNVWT